MRNEIATRLRNSNQILAAAAANNKLWNFFSFVFRRCCLVACLFGERASGRTDRRFTRQNVIFITVLLLVNIFVSLHCDAHTVHYTIGWCSACQMPNRISMICSFCHTDIVLLLVGFLFGKKCIEPVSANGTWTHTACSWELFRFAIRATNSRRRRMRNGCCLRCLRVCEWQASPNLHHIKWVPREIDSTID